MCEEIKLNKILIDQLHKFDKGGVYLNLGIGSGFFELCNNTRRHKKLYVSSVERECHIDTFKKIRDRFLIRPNYVCSDILDEKFEIRECKTYFNYILLQRFFPICRTDGYERIDFVLSKVTPYAQTALVVNSVTDLSEEQIMHLESKSKNIINISEDWNCWVIDLERIYEKL